MRIKFLFFLFFSSAIAAPAPYPAKPLDAATLTEATVLVSDVADSTAPGKTYLAGTLIAAPVTKLCAIIGDFAAYPGFMPNTTSATIVRKAETHTVVDMALSLPLGQVKRTRLQMQPTAAADGCKMSWIMLPRANVPVEEAIADTVGSWHISPHPTRPGYAVVQYFVYTDPGPVPFGLGWIVDTMGKESLPKTLEALRTRALKIP